MAAADIMSSEPPIQSWMQREKAVEISALLFRRAHNFFQSNRSHQNTCFHHVERNLSAMTAPTAAIQQYPPSRVATT
jgi:hypothetical protein